LDNLIIRKERESDYREVEEATREAFWNLYVPGCDEHYLVRKMRRSPYFIPELVFVAEWDGRIVGSIFFTKSYVADKQGREYETITFGPVSVLPELHGGGIGSQLIEYAIREAVKLGYRAILIYGYYAYYQRFGFRHAKDFGISNPDGQYPYAHLALELCEGALDGVEGKAYEHLESLLDEEGMKEYEATFPSKEKKVTPSQKIFEETSQTFL